jgi:hypothetical protein
MKMDQTECSERLAFKLQTPVNHPEKKHRTSCVLLAYSLLSDATYNTMCFAVRITKDSFSPFAV